MIANTEVPMKKFNNEVVKLALEYSFIWPLSARWTPTKAPANVASATANTIYQYCSNVDCFKRIKCDRNIFRKKTQIN